MNRKKTAALIGASTFTLLVGCGVPETPSPSASQGQEARDGKLGFTVRDVSQVDSVGDPYDPFAYQKAKSVFEVIRLTSATSVTSRNPSMRSPKSWSSTANSLTTIWTRQETSTRR
jgi:hypothetical protein